MKKLFILIVLLSSFIGLSAFAQLSTNGLVSFSLSMAMQMMQI